MKNAEGFVAQLDTDLCVHHQEVNASPMLDLIEVRTGHADGEVDLRFYDRQEGRKLSRELAEAAAELDQVDVDLAEGAEAQAVPVPIARTPRYVIVRERLDGDLRVLDQREWYLLASRYGPTRYQEATRWAKQLNESSDVEDAAKAARAGEGEGARTT